MHTLDSSTSLCIGYGTQVTVKAYWALVLPSIAIIHRWINLYSFMLIK